MQPASHMFEALIKGMINHILRKKTALLATRQIRSSTQIEPTNELCSAAR